MINLELLKTENVHFFWKSLSQSFRVGYEIEEEANFIKNIKEDLKRNPFSYFQITDDNLKLVGGFKIFKGGISHFFIDLNLPYLDKLIEHILRFIEPNNSKIIGYIKERYVSLFLTNKFNIDYIRYTMLLNFNDLNSLLIENGQSSHEITDFSEFRLKEIVDLFKNAYENTVDQRILRYQDTERIYQMLQMIINNKRGSFIFLKDCSFIATKDNKVIGVILIALNMNKPLILDIAVSRDYQGQGIGRNLILKSIKSLSTNFSELSLTVTKDNFSAEQLYQSLGFKKITEDFYALIREDLS
ncbi:MAG: GNAT family N-acetyltransferase [Candidatus Lokiarchaeota archaeon]|nr:GNAT family N-acetyltransferase [Candidatus Lokiarchaeota archaeon]